MACHGVPHRRPRGAARLASNVFEQAGILQAQTLDEAWALAEALTHAPPLLLPAIAADGGSNATLGCDALERAELVVPVVGPALQAYLAALLPAWCLVANPLDYPGFVEEQPAAAAVMIVRCLADPGGCLLPAGHFGGHHPLASDTIAAVEQDGEARLGGIATAVGSPALAEMLVTFSSFWPTRPASPRST